MERVLKVKLEENLKILKYIPRWRVKKFRAQRLLIHMLNINQAIVIFPWWKTNALLPLCVKCGGLTYPIRNAFDGSDDFYVCYGCDFVMHTNYK